MSPPQQEPNEGKGSQALILTQPSGLLQGAKWQNAEMFDPGALLSWGQTLDIFSKAKSLHSYSLDFECYLKVHPCVKGLVHSIWHSWFGFVRLFVWLIS